MAKNYRINANFSERAYQALEKLAEEDEKTMTEVLRDAIALKKWFNEERASGARILVERADGQIREVVTI